MFKQTATSITMEYYSGIAHQDAQHKKEWITDAHNNLHGSQGNCVE